MQLQLLGGGVAGLASWLLVLAMAVKVAATCVGIADRARPFLADGARNVNWWGSKVSALVLCGAAVGLCWVQRDSGGVMLFAGLLVAALFAVVVKVRGRG